MKKPNTQNLPIVQSIVCLVLGFAVVKFAPGIIYTIRKNNTERDIISIKKEKAKKKYVAKKVEEEKVEVVRAQVKTVVAQKELFKGEIKHHSFNSIINEHCISCHGEEGKEVEGEFDMKRFLAKGGTSSRTWRKIYSQIVKHEMPPKEEAPLTDEEREVLIRAIKLMSEQTSAPLADVRTLTPNEIKFTIKDILDYDEEIYNPFPSLYPSYEADKFFTEQRDILSPYYVDELYAILNDVVKSYIHAKPQTKPLNLATRMYGSPHLARSFGDLTDIRWDFHKKFTPIRFNPPTAKQQAKIDEIEKKVVAEKKAENRRKGIKKSIKRTRGKKDARDTGDAELNALSLPAGDYKFSFDAMSMNMDTYKIPQAAEIGSRTYGVFKRIITKYEYGLPLEFYITPPGTADRFFNKPKFITKFDIGKDGFQRYTVEFTLSRRASIDVRFPAAVGMPNDLGMGMWISQHQVKVDWEKKHAEKAVEKYMKPKNYRFPMVRVKNWTIEGPFNVKTNPYTIAAGEDVKFDVIREKFFNLYEDLQIQKSIAYPYVYRDLRKDGLNVIESYGNAMTAFMLSPQFLILDNKSKKESDRNRFVSYGLHKSMPSQEFLTELRKARKSKSGTEFGRWLINHKRFRRFSENFAYQWFQMGKINDIEPEPQKFGAFYSHNLAEAYKKEMVLFLENLFKTNRPMHELVTADYSFLNANLVNTYNHSVQLSLRKKPSELKKVAYSEFSRYKFNNPNRGGVLAMGAFLTPTGNGVDPLPIRRSAWVLENLLDSPLPPPPKGVNTDQFEQSRQMTLRERLEAHSKDPNCYNCHKRIDPLAVILDTYDTIGGTNREYRQETVLLNGQKLSSISDLKNYIKGNPGILARGVLRQMLKFSLGREIYIQDEEKIDRILEKTKAEGYRASDIYCEMITEFFLK